MRGRSAACAAVLALALASCADDARPALPGPAASGSATGSAAPPSGSTDPSATAPGSVLTRGPVRLTVARQEPAQRPVLDSYLAFFAAYADALGRADASSAELRRRSTPGAFADFARAIAGNAREGVTLRGPLLLRPAVQPRGQASLTVTVVDCLDATGQRFYDRSGKPTGETGSRRPIRVQLVDSPGAVRFVVGYLTDGPASACERSGS